MEEDGCPLGTCLQEKSSRNEALLRGVVVRRGELANLPPRASRYCQIVLKVGDEEYDVEASDDAAETMAGFYLGDCVETAGRLRVERWETASGRRSRIVLTADTARRIARGGEHAQ
jgi:hypothetical protein